jgi:membrane-associated phospholipid phosphatase
MSVDVVTAQAVLANAAWAGEHALPLFLVMLAGVLLLAWLGWWLGRRHLVPQQSEAPLTLWRLGLRIVLGFGIVISGAALFAEIAEALQAQALMGQADEVFSTTLRQSVAQPVLQVFALITRLGDTQTLSALGIGVALLLWWSQRRALALGWVMAVAGNGLLNHSLKQVFARARPLHDDGLMLAQGYSFPSGHSSGSLVAYGMLAYLALQLLGPRWRLPAVLLAALLAFSVGASRAFLRVHYASDVLAGFASGAAWLAVCIVSLELTQCWRQRRSPSPIRA